MAMSLCRSAVDKSLEKLEEAKKEHPDDLSQAAKFETVQWPHAQAILKQGQELNPGE